MDEMSYNRDQIQQLHKRVSDLEEWKRDWQHLVINRLSQQIIEITKELNEIKNERDERP